MLLLFFDPALGGYISEDEEKAAAEEEEDIEILITQSLAEGCEEEKKSVGVGVLLFFSSMQTQTVSFFF